MKDKRYREILRMYAILLIGGGILVFAQNDSGIAETPSTSRTTPSSAVTEVAKPGQSRIVDLGDDKFLELVWIPSGTFMMGGETSAEEVAKLSAGKAKYFANEHPQHEVTISRGFWLGKYEVTQEQWEAVMDSNPSDCRGEKNLPVENVTWDDCQEFLRKLNVLSGPGFRLPSEAEWEYACRAGTTSAFCFGETISTEQVNYDGRYTYDTGLKSICRYKTTPVGSFPANAWGVHDMHGNVWEWCADYYDEAYYGQSPKVDPQGPRIGELRTIRGGSWISYPVGCRSAYRYGYLPSTIKGNHIGFRIACSCVFRR